ncbi:N-acetyltransferase 8-like isoform X2 [Dendrobates tinctorius]|uniref:N-acetyltransferase 8-like isoform X2 n=1 Tax=Dendrobates tinctorius TaxID=92724 RepID=UPI003CC98F91
MKTPVMSGFHIRFYQDSDYHIVRDIFARGITEHVGVAFRYTLRLPQVWLPALAVTWLPLLITGSPLASALIGITILGVIWFMNRRIFTSYTEHSLSDDMLDIQKYYLQREDRCFWVAESDGEIVGTVAAAPKLQEGGEKQMELKRLSVPRRHRGRGIGAALCRTIIDFARERDYKAVVLDTSLHQASSCHLYDKMGFRRTRHCYPENCYSRYIEFIDVYYRYDVHTQESRH